MAQGRRDGDHPGRKAEKREAAVRKPAQESMAHLPPGKGQMLDAPRPGGHAFIPMWTTPDPLVNVAEALALDWTTVERLAEEDRQELLREWERWVSEPVPMYLVVRLMAAIYVRIGLPAEVTTPEQAEAWACGFAHQHRCRVCLVVSRRWSVWIDADGQVEARTEARPGEPNMPLMRVRGRRFLLEGYDHRGPGG